MMRFLYFVFIILFCATLPAQSRLLNPSFEGEPQDATVPTGWLPCQPGTTPDILPGVWGVYQEASHGNTFVGLITREDGSWESIGQRLKTPLEAGECYTFSLDLAYSGTYAGYNLPLKLRIWGAEAKCGKDLMVWESPMIKHRSWKRYKVEFVTKKKVNYILLEAFYSEGRFSHRGNILIDNISSIQGCNRA